MINITGDDISPRNISRVGCGAKALAQVVGNIVVVTSNVEIVMKEKALFSDAHMASQ